MGTATSQSLGTPVRPPDSLLPPTSGPTQVPTITPRPATMTPTATSLPPPTGTATPGPPPTATFPPTSTIPPPTPTPEMPVAEIDITNPGPLSKVISPIPLRALVVPGAEGKVMIELLGEDGRVLVRQLVYLNANLGRKAGLVADVDFDIAAVGEAGRLQITVLDEFGRARALASVDLILLTEGVPDLTIPGDRAERLLIEEPQPGALVQGGVVVLAGQARPISKQSLVAEIITEDGRVVGTRLVDIPAGPVSEHRHFLVEIPYSVTEPTWVRIILRERGDRIPGTAYLSSVEVLLSP